MRTLGFSVFYCRFNQGIQEKDGTWIPPAPIDYSLLGNEYGVLDSLGHRLRSSELNPKVPREVDTCEGISRPIDVGPIDPNAKWIKIQVFSPAEMKLNQTAFIFNRVR